MSGIKSVFLSSPGIIMQQCVLDISSIDRWQILLLGDFGGCSFCFDFVFISFICIIWHGSEWLHRYRSQNSWEWFCSRSPCMSSGRWIFLQIDYIARETRQVGSMIIWTTAVGTQEILPGRRQGKGYNLYFGVTQWPLLLKHTWNCCLIRSATIIRSLNSIPFLSIATLAPQSQLINSDCKNTCLGSIGGELLFLNRRPWAGQLQICGCVAACWTVTLDMGKLVPMQVLDETVGGSSWYHTRVVLPLVLFAAFLVSLQCCAGSCNDG